MAIMWPYDAGNFTFLNPIVEMLVVALRDY